MYWYRLLFAVLLPWFWLRHLWQGRRDFSWAQQQSRLGFRLPPLAGRWVVHCVSVGELQAALPLIKRLLQQEIPIAVSFSTFTAARLAAQQLPLSVPRFFFPYDLAFTWSRAFEQVRGFLLLETELWPLHLAYCQRQGIPVLLLNGRLSARSFQRYQRHPWLHQQLFPKLSQVLAQTTADAERFKGLGAHAVVVAGNLKSQAIDQQDKRYLTWQESLPVDFHRRPLWLAASIHRGEEGVILAAHRQLKKHFPKALLCLVPRHPERFSVKDFQGFNTAWRSKTPLFALNSDIDLFVIDCMGELTQWYRFFPIVFIGGSLKKIGGHNPLEAAAAGCALLSGKYFFNFQSIFSELSERKALTIIRGAGALSASIAYFWQVPGAFTAAAAMANQVLKNQPDALSAHWQILKKIFKNQ
jgi:3-deoxy-D-manno-octulosonic-acid transferase